MRAFSKCKTVKFGLLGTAEVVLNLPLGGLADFTLAIEVRVIDVLYLGHLLFRLLLGKGNLILELDRDNREVRLDLSLFLLRNHTLGL